MAQTLRYDAGAGAYDRFTGRWSRMYIADVMNAAGVTTGFHVLDVATGTGDAAIRAADLVGRGGRVVAVDISGPMLREAAAKAADRQIEFLQVDALDLPFAEATFDAVLCLFGLMFLPNQVAALKAFRRMLRPKGALVATCWDRSVPHSRGGARRRFARSCPRTVTICCDLFRSPIRKRI